MEMEDEEKTQIRHRVTDALLFEAKVEGETKAARLGFAVKAALEAKIDLRSADLSGTDLRCADLRCVDLRSADLSGANLLGFNLRCANLLGANLRSVNLQGVNLQGADLRVVNLQGADLRCANLHGTALLGANLSGANLDLSSGIPFGCWSFGFKCDFRLIAQIMCHVARLESDDPQAMEIIAEVRHRWGNDFCEFRDDVLPGNWDEESKPC